MARNQDNEMYSNSINIIGNTTNIVGDIISESYIRIDGNIKAPFKQREEL